MMTTRLSTSESSDDLHWQAFQYIAGELTDAATEAFELQLATDQAAREAVAQAVELSQAVCALPREFTVPQPTADSSQPVSSQPVSVSIVPTPPQSAIRRMLAVTVAVASVVIVAGVVVFNQSGLNQGPGELDQVLVGTGEFRPPEVRVNSQFIDRADRLVAIWTEAEMAVNQDFEQRAADAASHDDWAFLADDVTLEAGDDEVVVPNWLITAVSSVDVEDATIPSSTAPSVEWEN